MKEIITDKLYLYCRYLKYYTSEMQVSSHRISNLHIKMFNQHAVYCKPSSNAPMERIKQKVINTFKNLIWCQANSTRPPQLIDISLYKYGCNSKD